MANWTDLGFDDSQWDMGRAPLGFPIAQEITGSDVGGPAAAGSYTVDEGVYTVRGSGVDIWGTADSFHYVYTRWIGDGEITARVASMTNTNSWAKVGVMIRETLDGGSRNVFSYITPGSGKAIQNRSQTGQGSVHSNTPGYSAPQWVRLVRQGDTFYAYHSIVGTG